MVSSKILIIEDENSVREGLVDSLGIEGYTVISRDNGKDGVEAYQTENPDLVILDVMMPGLDGIEVCRRIRASGNQTPIIILTAKCSEIDKVVGLEIGADDYLTKPFGMRELFARVKAVLRRYGPVVVSSDLGSDPVNASVNISVNTSKADFSSRDFTKEGSQKEKSSQGTGVSLDHVPEELQFSDVSIDFRRYRATKGDRAVTLSAKEFELIKYLARQPDVPVSRDELLDHVWGYTSYPTTRTVDNFISRLRQKLEDSPEKPRFIVTVHGIGYKFVRHTLDM
ncbi:MAG TPA: response regulator transcription factor [Oligoflexia bacterium]|nr:response regulator transcription factor [Oligoflexia bacterium]HMP48756.1 response regulator transcription factor [Oligoflexia bacterium]